MTSPANFCIVPTASSGIDPATEFPVVSADYTQGSGSFHVAEVESSTTCSGWEIFTFSIDGTGTTASEATAFSLVAP